MIHFPKKLEALVLRYLKETFYGGTSRKDFISRPFNEKDLKFFATGAAKLSQMFTEERAALPRGYLNQPPLRAGYLLYFLPINFAKTFWVLTQIPPSFWKRKNFRILDLGAGPGSASLAFLTCLETKSPATKVEVHLVDQNKKILQDARSLMENLRKELPGLGEVKIFTQESDLKRFRFSGNYDLIFLSHVLNEFSGMGAIERAAWLYPEISQHLHPSGICAITEPALKSPTRELMALRDHLVESKELTVIAPCLHENICPMLAATRNDWCHFYLDWEEPEYLKKLDRMIGNENRFLKVAYLILAPKKSYPDLLKRPKEIFRVISNRMATRGKTEVVLCGPPGRIRVTRLDRDRSPENSPLDQVRRGDLITLQGFPSQKYQVNGTFRLNKQGKFKINR